MKALQSLCIHHFARPLSGNTPFFMALLLEVGEVVSERSYLHFAGAPATSASPLTLVVEFRV